MKNGSKILVAVLVVAALVGGGIYFGGGEGGQGLLISRLPESKTILPQNSNKPKCEGGELLYFDIQKKDTDYGKYKTLREFVEAINGGKVKCPVQVTLTELDESVHDNLTGDFEVMKFNCDEIYGEQEDFDEFEGSLMDRDANKNNVSFSCNYSSRDTKYSVSLYTELDGSRSPVFVEEINREKLISRSFPGLMIHTRKNKSDIEWYFD
ncbi:hypothetical protein HYW82_03895 [Candidatus Peregrinibacteria bacterium]|nr:hypothetical protein [Candidatus Peregrinibacteria bacterium]